MTKGRQEFAIATTPGALHRVSPATLAKARMAWTFKIALAFREGEEALPGWPEGPQLETVEASVTLRFPATRRHGEAALGLFFEDVVGKALRGPSHWPEGKWIRSTGPAVYAFGGVTIVDEDGPGRTVVALEYSR